jgi:starch synthase
MRVLQVSAEIFPLLKTGGLADVAGALPAALHAVGCEMRALLPGFPAIRAGLRDDVLVGRFALPWGERAELRRGVLPDVPCGGAPLPAYMLDVPGLFRRPGNPYEDAARRPYADNHRRFAALGWAAAQLGAGLDADWMPQLLHGHDWHAGLVPAYLRLSPLAGGRHVPCVHTVHNLAYQGIFDASQFADLGLPEAAFGIDGLEFYGNISFMKSGIVYADSVTTVSPSYAREIQTAAQGHGLDGLLRARRDHLGGILNAIDTEVWNPARDPWLVSHYEASRMAGKARCKAALQSEAGLQADAGAPLCIVVSRLTEQKGLSLVLAGIDEIIAAGGQLMLLGSGDAELEQAFLRAAQANPGRVAVHLGYDEARAHRMFGGGDITLVPSLFEPCGLTQIYGLAYGCVPLVRAVGGLADTVVDTDLASLDDGSATGVSFAPFSEEAYRHALRRAFALYRRPRDWARVRRTGMNRDAGWRRSAQQYHALYESLLPRAAA